MPAASARFVSGNDGNAALVPTAFAATPLNVTLIVVVAVVVLAVLAAFAGRALIRRGLKEPWVVRRINRLTYRLLELVKRPLTIAVLEEVADVLGTGHYSRNVAAALLENRAEIEDMIAEKIKADRTTGAINLVPFHDQLIHQATTTTMRVILEVLADPRTDEFVSDVLRDNIAQIRAAVRTRSTDRPAQGTAPDPGHPDVADPVSGPTVEELRDRI